ncbi:hypothetical protein [Chitinophaga solisilvae]|uniref:hypothetical protein n=1 Tax=Chitinophaga solisilvae TaxID=1233460 RepID=UPI001370511B|nr:hypothetical protein [Chitinophaga solisilvae]
MKGEMLHEQLFRRWIAACEEYAVKTEREKQVVHTVFAETRCYDISQFSGGRLPAGTPVSHTRYPDCNYVYGLDAAGKPCCYYPDVEDALPFSAGIFNYGNDFAEYIEYGNDDLLLPEKLDRMELQDGKPVAYLSLVMHLGRLPAACPKEEDDWHPLIGKYSFFYHVERYIYEGGRIVAAEGYASEPAGAPVHYRKYYRYGADGLPDEIRKETDSGCISYEYVRFPAADLERLTDELAVLVAASITEGIAAAEYEGPLTQVHLRYSDKKYYWPQVFVLPVAKDKDIVSRERETFTWGKADRQFVAHNVLAYQRPFTALMGYVRESGDYSAVENMLRKAACMLTKEQLSGRVSVTAAFIALALDTWSYTDVALCVSRQEEACSPVFTA